jgi:hypothetical protein
MEKGRMIMTRTYTRPIMPTSMIPPTPRLINPAPAQKPHPTGYSGWTAEDAARRPAVYLRWLRSISTERWLAIHAAPQRSAQDFDQAIAVCRAYKAKYTEYTRKGSPVQMRPELQRLQTQMRATLKRLNFASPAALWEAYQEQIAARDRHGRHPRHAAHIASVEHYQWLCEISRVPPMDYYAGSTDGIYNNVDMELERARNPRTTYAPADDVDSPAARLTYLHTRIAHRQAQRASLEPRILGLNRRLKVEAEARRRIAYQTRKERLQAIYRRAGQELRDAQAEYAELDRILHPQKYGIERAPADQRELVALAAPDYGLISSPPIPTNGRWQIIDLDGRLADPRDSFRSLLSWHVRNQDVIFEMETYPQNKRSLAHNAHLAARYDLQNDLTRSLGLHHSRQLARHAPAPLPPPSDETGDWL